jgi:predicted nuclease with TOPRIM domain
MELLSDFLEVNMDHPVKKFFREHSDKFEASPGKPNWAIERERLITDNESLRAHADNLRMQLRQETARLNHADKEIDRLKKLAESFKEQTRKALAEQYKLSVRITEFENERKAKVS